MGQWMSRIHTGSDSFFTGIDGKLGSLEDRRKILEERKGRQERVWRKIRTQFFTLFVSIYVCILAYAIWVIQQPRGTFTGAQHAARISPVFVSPAVAYIWYQAMALIFKAFLNHTESQIHKCHEKTDKILHGLKDTMRYDRTHALLSKYDPEYNATTGLHHQLHGSKHESYIAGGNHGEIPAKTVHDGRLSLPKKVTAVAASTVGGAGMRLSGALAQLWSLTADTVIGDDPILLNSLKVAENQAQVLESENLELKKKIERYEEQFGLLYDVQLEGRDDMSSPIVKNRASHDGSVTEEEDDAGGIELDNNMKEEEVAVEKSEEDSDNQEETVVHDQVVVEEEPKEEPRRRSRRSLRRAA